MTYLHLAARISGKFAMLVILLGNWMVPCWAQYDFEIMVNGPWTYIKDPKPKMDDGYTGDRIILVAPSDCQHAAKIWSGPDASMMHAMSTSNPPNYMFTFTASEGAKKILNLYYLDFPGRSAPSSNPPADGPPTPYTPINKIKGKNRRSVLYNPPGNEHDRWAISLPMPDSVGTYSVAGGYGNGSAEGRIGPDSANGSNVRANYTTWMVLHYGVSTLPNMTTVNVKVHKSMKDKPTGSIATVPADPGTLQPLRNAISIFLGDAKPCMPNDLKCWTPTEKECDGLSGQSFAEATALWGLLKDYARFPVQLDGMGNQDPGNYDDKFCPVFHGSSVAGAILFRAQEELRNKNIVENINKIRVLLLNLPQQWSLDKGTSIPNKDEMEVVGKINDGVQTLQTEFAKDFPRGVPPKVAVALKCTSSFVNRQHIEGCPSSREQVIAKYFEADGPLDGDGKGSADCHSPQIFLNQLSIASSPK